MLEKYLTLESKRHINHCLWQYLQPILFVRVRERESFSSTRERLCILELCGI